MSGVNLASDFSSRTMPLVCCRMMPSSSIGTRQAASQRQGMGILRHSPPHTRQSPDGKFAGLQRSNVSPSNSGKNARRLRSPCCSAFVSPMGALAPARRPPPPDLDCWFFAHLRCLPCGPLLKQRGLTSFGLNLLRRFSSSQSADEKKPAVTAGFLEFGRHERIRTSDPRHPMTVRYQAALHADAMKNHTTDSRC